MAWKDKARLGIIVILACVLILWFYWVLEYKKKWDDVLRIRFFDVGQGDSALIEYKDFTMLIDGGPDKSIQYKIGKMLSFFDRQIDYVVATHPHDDHYFGLISLFQRFDIGTVILSPLFPPSRGYAEFLKRIDHDGASVILAPEIHEIRVDDDLVIRILYPTSKEELQDKKNINNASVVIRLTYGQMDVLFTGDIEKEVEKKLLECCRELLDSEILKVAHHGSDTSSTLDFLKAVDPQVSIISVGRKNPFGHPSMRILFRLKQFGSKVFRTDVDGDVELFITQNGYEVF